MDITLLEEPLLLLKEPSLIGNAQADTWLIVERLNIQGTVAAQSFVVGLLEGAIGVLTLDDDLLDGVVIEAHGCNIGSAMAVLALVRACHHRVVMVETAEKVQFLSVSQSLDLREEIVARLDTVSQCVAANIGVVEGVAVLVLMVCGVGLVVGRDAISIGKERWA